MSNALQFEAIWRTAFQKKEKEDAYVRYVLFSVSADCRKYRLHQNGRLRQAAVHSAFAGSARRRTDPPFACRHGGRGADRFLAPPFWPMVFLPPLPMSTSMTLPSSALPTASGQCAGALTAPDRRERNASSPLSGRATPTPFPCAPRFCSA